MKKVLSMLLAVVMVLALAAPCFAAEADRTLRVEAIFTSEWFNPLVYGNTDKVVMHALFDTLTKFDNDGNVIPGLAKSWEKDGNKVTFHLNEAYFTDGNRVKASDVVFSFNTILQDTQLKYNMTMWAAGCEAVDDETVVFTLTNSYCRYENFLAELLYVVEEEGYDPDTDWASQPPVGSGPYIFEGQDNARTVKLTANPNYWNGEPAIKNVEVVACIDDATALIALQTGELDIASQIGKAAYAQTATMDGVTDVSFNGWQNSGLFDFVDDVNFRQAVFHAINRDTLVAICLDGNGAPCQDLFAAKVSGKYAGAVSFTGYDLDLAKEEIAKSEADLSRVYTIEVYDADSAAAAQCIQADLAVIGIQTEIVEEEVGTWFDNLMAGNMDFSIAAMGTDMVGTEDMLSIYNPNGGYPLPVSDELVQMVKNAPTIADDDERYAEVVKTIELAVEEAAWVPLFDAPMYYAYNSSVKGTVDVTAATCVMYVGDMSFAD